MENKGYIGVIIPAAGSGSRMGGVYKPLEKLCGKEMLLYSLDTFQNCDCVGFVVISAREDKIDEVKKLCEDKEFVAYETAYAFSHTLQELLEQKPWKPDKNYLVIIEMLNKQVNKTANDLKPFQHHNKYR